MIDVEETLRAELDRLVPIPAPADWGEVLQLANSQRGQERGWQGERGWGGWRVRMRSAAVIVALAGALIALAFATPLGAAIARGFDGFSSWISGEPGSPAPKADQQAFARANARTWLGFPAGTKLRLLDSVIDPATGERVEMLGFRSGGTLCLSLHVIGKVAGTRQSCAPLSELRQAGAPVRVVLVDDGFGTGKHTVWYGLDRIHSSALQVTAGIAADGVRAVTLTDQAGTHAVKTAGNAFLYVAWNPIVGQRVSKITTQTASRTVAVPFAQAPFLSGAFGAYGSAGKRPFGPSAVQRHVTGGTIGWLDRRQPVGQPLSVLPKHPGQSLLFGHVVFGRVIAPDPTQPIRIAVVLSTSRHGVKAIGVCTTVFVRGGAGGGCAVRAQLFAKSPIASTTTMLISGSDEFATVDGLASDDVSKIVAFLANRQRQPVPFSDNAYVVDIARANLPAKLVAYDKAGKIIGITTVDAVSDGGEGTPAPGRAKPLLHVTSPTASATLYTGPSSTDGRCMYVRWYENKQANGEMDDCAVSAANGPALSLSGGGPSAIWEGRVRSDVTTVELRFADGSNTQIKPTDGFILYALTRSQLSGGGLTEAIARNAAGKALGHESFKRNK